MTDKNMYDVIMVGGGVMGCATAYYLLKNDPQVKVAIIEKDPTYEFNSSCFVRRQHSFAVQYQGKYSDFAVWP